MSSANLSMTAPAIVNQSSAVVSAVQNVNINALNSLTNAGTIQAALGNININAANIANSSAITATMGNINITSGLVQNLNLNNINGSLSAVNGIINFRDASFSSIADLNITGGDLLANTINLYSGGGAIDLSVNKLEGTLNTYSNYASVGANTDLLTLGEINISGDPTYFNSAVNGDIAITGDISVSESLTIIASRNISTTAGVNLIQARNGSGQGFNINIIAGANVSGTGTTSNIAATPPVAGNASSLVTVSGASASGGDIDFTASTNLQINANSTCAGCSGANVTLAAFGAGAAGGHILLRGPTSAANLGSQIDVSGNGAANGNVTLIAGATSGTAITTGKITASGGTAGTGIISISTAQPQIANGLSLVFNTDGSVQNGNSLIASATIENASVNITNELSAGKSINVTAGSNINSLHQAFRACMS